MQKRVDCKHFLSSNPSRIACHMGMYCVAHHRVQFGFLHHSTEQVQSSLSWCTRESRELRESRERVSERRKDIRIARGYHKTAIAGDEWCSGSISSHKTCNEFIIMHTIHRNGRIGLKMTRYFTLHRRRANNERSFYLQNFVFG